jgi:hypothetical protein
MSRARLLFVAAALAIGGTTPVLAQSSQCQDLKGLMEARKSIVEKINGLGKKKMEPNAACQLFTQLTANGTQFVKFIDVNKDWCQIPDQFAAGMKTDHERTTKIRAQACSVAQKQQQMMKQARQAQQNGGPGAPSGLLGGPGLTGQHKMPQGAL